MKLARNHLERSGYRLPTEAEWEYACRAGAVTSRNYGESAELLGKYAWFQQNAAERSWPVGLKKPNDLGLLDMHGNVWCLCQERHKDYLKTPNKAVEDKEDVFDIKDKHERVLRGGTFLNPPSYVRCASRAGYVPTGRETLVGFRPARTMPP
jgi:formylglycine-generating enzyme required for sulfatase activity